MSGDYYLELRNISKFFPGVKALDKVNFEIRKGEVHVLCGENGAGKTTLMKILNGIYHTDEGEILIEGSPVEIKSPLDARYYGISMIFQECAYVPEMDIAENLFLGDWPVNALRQVNWKQIYEKTKILLQKENLLAQIKFKHGVYTKLRDLSISDIQMLEIVKAISKGFQVLIMDEPTSSLALHETEILLQKVLELKKRGKSIIYISHKMDEIFKIADRITIFRDGKTVCSKPVSDLSIDEVITQMVGRTLSNDYPKKVTPPGKRLLSINHLTRKGFFYDISFSLNEGEIVGFAGLVGAGRTEVMRAICGFDPIDSGTIECSGKKIVVRNVSDSIQNGIAMCTEDRRRYGLVLVRSVKENIGLPNLEKFIFRGKCHKKIEEKIVKEKCALLKIKTPGLDSIVAHLSGGNQQKVVLGKWLLKDPSVLILDEPTRGIDVGAKYEIYKFMSQIVQQKHKGIIMVSSEMPELIGMCDRIYVMTDGCITGLVERKDFSQELIMKYATGQKTTKGVLYENIKKDSRRL
ncbi:sugar ABC transporter ATP-binding protein [Treponema sp. OMZ 840]|uniref:sugar ABC transporter ATP-binding protein n=1 Tax=Treponema sp. OMZ 840 TaxID=244313 RepID=UPI003D93DFDB